jgi:chromosome partitioning protein
MAGMTESCSICGRIFDVQFRYQMEERDGGFAFYCSHECHGKAMRGEQTGGVSCDSCKKLFVVELVSQIVRVKGERRYACSDPCRTQILAEASGARLGAFLGTNAYALSTGLPGSYSAASQPPAEPAVAGGSVERGGNLVAQALASTGSQADTPATPDTGPALGSPTASWFAPPQSSSRPPAARPVPPQPAPASAAPNVPAQPAALAQPALPFARPTIERDPFAAPPPPPPPVQVAAQAPVQARPTATPAATPASPPPVVSAEAPAPPPSPPSPPQIETAPIPPNALSGTGSVRPAHALYRMTSAPPPPPVTGRQKAKMFGPRRIAVFNHKGGTGKTTTTVSIASGLAAKGLKVLLVDTDSQGNVGVSLGVKAEKSLYHVLVMGLRAKDAAVEVRPNLDLIVANETLAAAELYLAGRQNRDRVLRERLVAASEDYDVVMLDCSPSLSLMNQNALVFADGILVPVACDFLSLVGVRQVIKTVKNVNTLLRHPVQIFGVLPTFYDARARICRDAIDTMKEHFGDKCLPPVRATIKIKEAPAQGRTIYEYAPDSNAARDYRRIVDYIVDGPSAFAAPFDDSSDYELDDLQAQAG